jgi:hypothetical protein
MSARPWGEGRTLFFPFMGIKLHNYLLVSIACGSRIGYFSPKYLPEYLPVPKSAHIFNIYPDIMNIYSILR